MKTNFTYLGLGAIALGGRHLAGDGLGDFIEQSGFFLFSLGWHDLIPKYFY